MENVVELRCGDSPRRMFGKLLVRQKPRIVDTNLIEFACRDCEKELQAARVLHRFDVAGELVEIEVRR